MNRIRATALAITAALLIVACSGSETSSSADVTDPASSVDPTPVVTAEVETTVAPTTTEPISSTTAEPVETDPTTTVEETTTTAAGDTPEAEVLAAIEFFEQQWKTCLEALPTCDTLAVTERRGREDVGTIQGQAIRWNQNDYRVENANAYNYDVQTVSVDGSEATAQVCVTDPLRLTESDGTVVDDNYFTYILDWTLTRRDDGEWWVESRIQNGEEFVGQENDICASV